MDAVALSSVFVCLFVCLFICTFVHFYIWPFVHLYICSFVHLLVCLVWKLLSVFSNSVFVVRLHTGTHIYISWQSIPLCGIFVCNNENILSTTPNLNCFFTSVISCPLGRFVFFSSKMYEYQYYYSQINRSLVTLLTNGEHHTNKNIHTYHSSNMAYITRAQK